MCVTMPNFVKIDRTLIVLQNRVSVRVRVMFFAPILSSSSCLDSRQLEELSIGGSGQEH